MERERFSVTDFLVPKALKQKLDENPDSSIIITGSILNIADLLAAAANFNANRPLIGTVLLAIGTAGFTATEGLLLKRSFSLKDKNLQLERDLSKAQEEVEIRIGQIEALKDHVSKK